MNVLLKTRSALRSCWGLLTAPEPGVPGPEPLAVARRGPARELLVALAMALLTAGVEELMDAGALAMALSAASAFGLWLLRRRLPATVLILMSALGAAFAGFALMQMFVAWSAGRRIALPGRALAAFAVSYLLYLGTGLAEIGMWARQSPVALTMFGTLAFLAMVVVPGLTSRYWSQRRTLLHALQERNTQLVWEHQMVAGQARLLERQRIAQDMHDSLGHQLALIAVHTGALEVDTSLTERQREAVGVLRNASVTAMHELREVVGILRDGIEGTPPCGRRRGTRRPWHRGHRHTGGGRPGRGTHRPAAPHRTGTAPGRRRRARRVPHRPGVPHQRVQARARRADRCRAAVRTGLAGRRDRQRGRLPGSRGRCRQRRPGADRAA